MSVVSKLFTAFRHKGEVSMSKVGVLLFALAVAFAVIWGSIWPDKLTWIAVAHTFAGVLAFYVAVTNRKDSRRSRVSVSKQRGISIEQEFDHVDDGNPPTAT